MKSIFWFRNDLRTADNPALVKCLAASKQVVPVFVFDDRQFEETDLGLPKTGFFRAKFLVESLHDLRSNLQKLGSDLVIRKGITENELFKLAQEIGASTIYCSKETTWEEVDVEKNLEQNLRSANKKLITTWQSTLYHEEDIPWPINRLPEVFSNFRKEVEKEASIRTLVPAPAVMPSIGIAGGEIPTVQDLGLASLELSKMSAYPFCGGETAAMKRLQHYLFETDLIANYKNTRNKLIGTEYSSKLSAWLSLGCISPRTVFEKIKKYEQSRKKNQSTYWLIFELMWRDYFRFIAKKHGNRIFHLTGIQGEDPDLKNDYEAFNNWCNTETGLPFIDANMMELKKTGFMSNRGRQNVASYLVNDLKVNWTWGASYFESLLVDYDPCTNWGNWNYIGGVGNDPRKERHFNTEAQAERYDPKGQYVNMWLKQEVSKT